MAGHCKGVLGTGSHADQRMRTNKRALSISEGERWAGIGLIACLVEVP